ncbi:hypothetical protein L202_03621 [Cryptococcus amylolentus CBS 6039]|uniref:Uncharacterized protein n=1 Tax=Cryptococcus amylolentus CBS 6039 TaxID=1295533 RepID=A0A1E3HTL4_9TREE|nr:hypothetical protein L202_03621 [Cryptococcus amylolentus CBS 6039]ODN79693.1 hypothetical protein L202_03621 [Cryptococcus amylolentus CBS 6039]
MNPEQEENRYEGSVSSMDTTGGRPSSGYQQPATQRPLTMSSGTLPSGDENANFFDRSHPLYPRLAPVRDPGEDQDQYTTDPSMRQYYPGGEYVPGSSSSAYRRLLPADGRMGRPDRSRLNTTEGDFAQGGSFRYHTEDDFGQQGRTTGGEGGSRSQNVTFVDNGNTPPPRSRGPITRAQLLQHCDALTRENASLFIELNESTERFRAISREDMELLQQSEARVQALTEKVEQLKRERDAAMILSQRLQHDSTQGED